MGTISSTLSAGTSVANTPVTAADSTSGATAGGSSTNSTGIFTGTSA